MALIPVLSERTFSVLKHNPSSLSKQLSRRRVNASGSGCQGTRGAQRTGCRERIRFPSLSTTPCWLSKVGCSGRASRTRGFTEHSEDTEDGFLWLQHTRELLALGNSSAPGCWCCAAAHFLLATGRFQENTLLKVLWAAESSQHLVELRK